MGVIYQIPCDCGAVYISETGRTLKIWLKEHQRSIKTGDPNNAIARHYIDTGHKILWDQNKVLDQERNWWKRQTKAIYTRTTQNTINTDPGLILNPIWTYPLDRRLYHLKHSSTSNRRLHGTVLCLPVD